MLVQAAAVGKPLLSFNVDGAWEIIKDGVNGYIVPMKDIDAMADRLRFLIDNQEAREEMGRKSRELLSEAWDYRKMVEEIDKLYRQLIEKKGLKEG